MRRFSWNKVYPHLIAIGVFLLVALVYCGPALQGKVLQQQDITQWQGMSKDAFNYREKHGEFPLWINNMFSGMPSFQIAANYNNVITTSLPAILSLYLPKPINFFFLACICFYFLMQVLGVNRIISVMGALAFAYCTYNPIIIAAGHDTKMLTICFMPAFLGSLLLIFDREYWLGAGLLALSTGILIAANHLQVAYYTALVGLAAAISFVMRSIRQKDFGHLIRGSAFALVAAGIGVLTNASNLFSTYDFSKATIRGGSALSTTLSNKEHTGLSKDYAFSYSMYKSEPLVMMFPRFYGGSSDKEEKSSESSKAMEALSSLPQELQGQLQYNYRFYWGGIGYTSGPPYVGAIICFLAILGMFILDNKHKWWIAGITFFAILLSWGGYFEGFNEFIWKNFPMYNKFRAPSMILVIPELLLPLLACLSLDRIISSEPTSNPASFLQKKFRNGLIATAVIVVIAFLVYLGADFFTKEDQSVLQQVRNIPQQEVKEPVMSFFNGLKEDRQSLMLGSIFRSLIMIAAAAALIYFYLKGKIKAVYVTVIIGVLSFGEIMAVSSKYLNKSSYVEKEEYEASFIPTSADQAIMQDKTFYRVFNTTRDPFNDAITAYFHHSVGGYNPAKLSIYQDLIENQLSKQPANMAVFDMLNTKYFITGNPQNPQVQQNAGALGNAWFVSAVNWVKTADEEMKALDHFNPRDTAIVNSSFKPVVKMDATQPDSTATILMDKNDNDFISYESSNSKNGFGVFSEVFYDRGWKAFIDGSETPIVKVNYVLRGLSIPSGKHKIEFKFDPAAHRIGSTVTTICEILMILIILAGFYFHWRSKKDMPANMRKP
jgi:hypothetical protein